MSFGKQLIGGVASSFWASSCELATKVQQRSQVTPVLYRILNLNGIFP